MLSALLLLHISSQSFAGNEQPVSDSAYLNTIIAERKAADLKMRDTNYSPLAMTHLVLLTTETLSIGTDSSAGLRLAGPAVSRQHAQVEAESNDDGTIYTIRALDGQIFLAAEPAREVNELALKSNGPRLRIGNNLLYFQRSSALGPMMRVLNFESPAFTLFDGLNYYPADPDYRVEATVEPYDKPEKIEIVDTMGFVSDAWVYGMAGFTLKGHPTQLKLVLFTPEPQPDSVFYVIFGDKTNGRETYGAGRYLLPDFVASGSMTLDFNRSVNPSCAYNGGYACPMPPPGNRLSFAVQAGIKDYPHRPPR